MRVGLPRTLRQIVTLLLVCFALGAILTCEFHDVSLDHAHHGADPYDSGSPLHAAFGTLCLTAVLPALAFFLSLLSVPFLPVPLLPARLAPVLLPFKPPRPALHQSVI